MGTGSAAWRQGRPPDDGPLEVDEVSWEMEEEMTEEITKDMAEKEQAVAAQSSDH